MKCAAARDKYRSHPHPRRRSLGFGGARGDRAPEVTVKDAGVRWLRTYVPTTRNEKGQQLAQTRFVPYAWVMLGDIPLRELDGDDIRAYRLWREHDVRLSPCTVTHILSDLRCLLRWAVSAGLIERSVRARSRA